MKFTSLKKMLFTFIMATTAHNLGAMVPPAKDHYQTLGVARNADTAAITKAYKKLALKWHPDKNKEEGAQQRFAEISEAYSILSDPQKRKRYDAGESLDEQESMSPAEFFAAFFNIKVTVEDAMRSEAELLLQFKHATKDNNQWGWFTFISAFDTHQELCGQFSSSLLKILKELARLLLSKVSERSMAPLIKELESLKAQLQVEKNSVKKLDLQALILRKEGEIRADKRFVLNDSAKNALRQEIKSLLNELFEQQVRMDNTNEFEWANALLMALEPAFERIQPGWFKEKAASFTCEQTHDLQAVVAGLQESFAHAVETGAWPSFLALCARVIEKWGTKRELVYLQLLAQMAQLGTTTARDALQTFEKRLLSDVEDVKYYLRANRIEDVFNELTLLNGVGNSYKQLFKGSLSDKASKALDELREMVRVHFE